jgi:hypothetical protein
MWLLALCSIARSARCGSRREAAHFVVARRGNYGLRSLRVHCSLRSLRLAPGSRCLPHSLRRRKTCLLTRSSRTAARQPGSARRRAIRCLTARCRSLRIAPGSRRLCRRSQRELRLRSLRVHCSLRSLRLAPGSRCLPHSLRRRKTCLLTRSSRTAARQPGSARRRAIPDARSRRTPQELPTMCSMIAVVETDGVRGRYTT